jgi:radical SAM protein with 4Fe4S-binding SPASM domain
MKAKILDHQAPGGQRQKLQEILPLHTPLVIQIFPIYACNFQCSYCVMSKKKSERGFISKQIKLDWDVYVKFIRDLKEFPNKIKVLRFVGIGEPLLHPEIIDMLAFAKIQDVAEKIELLTNGSLIDKNFTMKSRGWIDRVVISLQGLDSESYLKTSNVKINFEEFVSNIKYFYKNKLKDTHLYIKIADCALKKGEDKKFYKLFGNICDSMSIENIVPLHSEMKYDKEILSKKETQFGLEAKEVERCPQAFFHIQLNPDGKIIPCYSWTYPVILGNVKKKSVKEIWNGRKTNKFRRDTLKKNKCKVCQECTMIQYRRFDEDMIDDENAKRLLKEYK